MRFKVGVIILNYNNIDDTINCIESGSLKTPIRTV